MYKKLLTALCVLSGLACLSGTAGAVSAEKAVEQALRSKQKELLMSPSTNARENVIPIEITVGASFVDSIEDRNDPLVKECPAVRISSHFLLASMACVGMSEYGKLYKSGGGSGDIHISNQKVNRWIINAKIDDNVIPGKDVFYSRADKLILIYINPANPALAKIIQPKPAVNLFVPKNPQSLKNTFSKKQLNRESFCLPGRTCADVSVSQVCNENGCFKLGFKFINGDSGDPVFGLNPELSTEEFLMGFNKTDVEVTSRQSGSWYWFFTQNSVNFIKRSIEKKYPKDWSQIQKKIINETYFINR
ncbi:hypothetical protein [Candidatus Avelusimicrobium facis]|uniref:hypothetical protein n=1 Tax=Candidatus Avelusimicrobium facis TaxID=3416203 RepID=UPI003D1153A9